MLTWFVVGNLSIIVNVEPGRRYFSGCIPELDDREWERVILAFFPYFSYGLLSYLGHGGRHRPNSPTSLHLITTPVLFYSTLLLWIRRILPLYVKKKKSTIRFRNTDFYSVSVYLFARLRKTFNFVLWNIQKCELTTVYYKFGVKFWRLRFQS